MNDLRLPVLIYGAKERCGACGSYDHEWEEIKRRLGGRARFVKFLTTKDRPPPPPLARYMTWYPSLILAGPKSYFRCFTPDDQVNTQEYSPHYTIRAKKFNAVETADGFEYAYGDNTADNTINWFNQVAPTVAQYDEPTPPRTYSRYFS